MKSVRIGVVNLARLEALDISGCDELESLNMNCQSPIQVSKGNGCWKLHKIQGLDLLNKLFYFHMSFNHRNTSMIFHL